jgi:hypothetical protein
MIFNMDKQAIALSGLGATGMKMAKRYNQFARMGIGKKVVGGAAVGAGVNAVNYNPETDGSFGGHLVGGALTGGAVGGAAGMLRPVSMKHKLGAGTSVSNLKGRMMPANAKGMKAYKAGQPGANPAPSANSAPAPVTPKAKGAQNLQNRLNNPAPAPQTNLNPAPPVPPTQPAMQTGPKPAAPVQNAATRDSGYADYMRQRTAPKPVKTTVLRPNYEGKNKTYQSRNAVNRRQEMATAQKEQDYTDYMNQRSSNESLAASRIEELYMEKTAADPQKVAGLMARIKGLPKAFVTTNPDIRFLIGAVVGGMTGALTTSKVEKAEYAVKKAEEEQMRNNPSMYGELNKKQDLMQKIDSLPPALKRTIKGAAVGAGVSYGLGVKHRP